MSNDTNNITLSDLIDNGITNNCLFNMENAVKWIDESKNKPIPKMLFDEFWFQNELCILYAETGQGKSALAYQISDSITKGIPIPGFNLGVQKQPIIYFDFELSAKQFELRYSILNLELDRCEHHYKFDESFKRAELSSNFDLPKDISFDEYLIQEIETTIIKTGIKVLIIDNITYFNDNLEKAREAAPLVKELKQIIGRQNCSFLILAHTPKRDLSRPITRNDLQGSKMLINFCDSAFAIGESQLGSDIKYLKQIKVRSSSFKHGPENVITCSLEKPLNFIQFRKLEHTNEREHLVHREHSQAIDSGVVDRIKELKVKSLTQRDIAKELGISLGVVNKYLKIK